VPGGFDSHALPPMGDVTSRSYSQGRTLGERVPMTSSPPKNINANDLAGMLAQVNTEYNKGNLCLVERPCRLGGGRCARGTGVGLFSQTYRP
jgi:hypothetical protein